LVGNIYKSSSTTRLKSIRLGAKRWVFRLKFNENTKARTLAANIIKTIRYRFIASSVSIDDAIAKRINIMFVAHVLALVFLLNFNSTNFSYLYFAFLFLQINCRLNGCISLFGQ